METAGKNRRKNRALIALSVVAMAGMVAIALSRTQASTPGLSLRLVSAQGVPSDCAATLWAESDGQRQASALSSQNCQEGRLHWEGLSEGAYRLMAQAKGMQFIEKSVQVGQEILDLGDVVLTEGRSVRGRVLLSGEPVAGALGIVEGGRRTRSDSEGRFSFNGLPKTALSLRAAAQAGRAGLEVSVDQSADEELLVQLERGRGQGLLGLKFEQKGSGPVVGDLLDGTAAAEQLQRGDRILRVDGVAVLELSAEEIAQLLAGQLDSKAKLEIERAGEQQSLTLNRIDPLLLTQD